jgi:hypothetical protein
VARPQLHPWQVAVGFHDPGDGEERLNSDSKHQIKDNIGWRFSAKKSNMA